MSTTRRTQGAPRRTHRTRARALAALLATGLLPITPVSTAVATTGPGVPPSQFVYVQSTDGGDDFARRRLGGAEDAVGITHVAAENGTIHGLFDAGTNDGLVKKDPRLATDPWIDGEGRKVLYRRSLNEGDAFQTVQRLDVGTGDSSESDLDSQGGNLDVVFEDDRLLADNTPDPSTEATGLGGPQYRFPNNNGSIVNRGANRDDVYYRYSTDGGTTFGSVTNLTCDAAPRSATEVVPSDPTNATKPCESDEVHNKDPDVARDGDLVVIAYEGVDSVPVVNQNNVVINPPISNGTFSEKADIWVQYSTDGGQTFSSPLMAQANKTPMMAGYQDEPSVDVAGTTVHIAFRSRSTNPNALATNPLDDFANDDQTLMYMRSNDGGQTFTAPAALPGNPLANAAAVLAQGDLVHVLGCSIRNEALPGDVARLLYWRSTDAGASFSGPETIANFSDGCTKPALDANGDELHIVVEGTEFGKEADTYYLQGDNAGEGGAASFGTIRNLSGNPLSSGDPSVAVDPADDDDVHVSWTDTSAFYFLLDDEQELPLEEGDTREFDNEDIVRYSGGSYSLLFDGSDVGLRSNGLDGLAQIGPNQFVLSLTSSATLPGVGKVDDSDLILFTASQTGEDTSGTFSMYLRGANIGLTSSDEDVDAVEVDLSSGTPAIYLSTTGSFSVPALSGKDEDVFVCRSATVGAGVAACGSIEMAIDGSAVGLTSSGEDIDAFSLDGIGFSLDENNEPQDAFAFISTTGSFSVPTGPATGKDYDIAQCFLDKDLVPLPSLPDCGTTRAPLQTAFSGEANLLDENVMDVEFPF